ncbi:ARF GTPase-activating protein GIT2-like isoform X5 [Takifugu rubripes]|uniref:ARF GTPase-activating protein GIT2-like isoform X5 n=1 Tax=Takifugu rubripes TaxID=31033 RepID=UPI0011459364|nr:ARF GTPase-activating protein GIT2-like isoform X5 [Takifugu rubripes]
MGQERFSIPDERFRRRRKLVDCSKHPNPSGSSDNHTHPPRQFYREMSKRVRSREVCADCSAPEPRWASVNRGVLVCDECCSIHRGLGRHSSQVRHLTHSLWPPSQLQMVQALYGNGANSIWEHSLLDPSSSMSGKRKANPQDKVHPNKTEFIKAKYQMLAYVHRMPCREDDSVTAKDLSKQLHSSVRTGNLETCLRLLSLGAQANFFHPEKGNTPLHIAARAGQILQAELLAVYGADPGALDSSGKTPTDYARQAGHHELAERLVEIQYELTDRLTFYLCGRRPDHRSGQHFIIPQMADSLDLSEFAKAAKKKLQSLSNHQFEELAMDVYDEVDRRETDAVWLATQNHSTLVTDTTVVPFLPVNPEYSSTRNQGRQKLARFSANEFATLVIDILNDAKRRQWGNACESPKGRPCSENVELILQGIDGRHDSESQDNDQPDYDSVASDEDPVQEATCGDSSSNERRTKSSESSDLSDGPITVQEFMEVKSALTASEAKIQQLLKVNCHLSEELRLMQSKLNSLQTENTTLRWQAPGGPPQLQAPFSRHPPRGGRAISMYETGYSPKQYPHRVETGRHEDGVILQPFPTNIGRGPLGTAASSLPTFPSSLSWSWDERSRRGCSLEGQVVTRESDYDTTPSHSELEETGSPLPGPDVAQPREEGGEGAAMPCTEDVICKTEQITKNIQELLRAAQETKHESFLPCSEKIRLAVTEMAALFPKRPSSETVRGSLCLLTASASRLHGECQKAAEHSPCPSDIQLVTQQVIQCAYDIAKAAKQLVTVTTKENNN